MRIGSLFSGIGGLELGLEWAGLGPVVWQVEKDPFCRAVLAKHWPDAERHDDVCTVGSSNLAAVDLICGGFPCQDISSACSTGERAGLAGTRSGLWVEFRRVIGELRPAWLAIENVASGAEYWVDSIRESLEQLGYASLPLPLSASDVGAPFERARVFIIASRSDSDGEPMGPVDAQTPRVPDVPESLPGWTELSRVQLDDGLSCGMGLSAFGNAVVPQCAEVVGWVIRELAGLTHPRSTGGAQ